MRPALPGVSIGHYRITAGTLGAIVLDKNGADGRAKTGDPILQPGPLDGGIVHRDTLAHLTHFVPIQYSPQAVTCPVASRVEQLINRLVQSYHPAYTVRMYRRTPGRNLVDAALAAPVNPADVKAEIFELGRVSGVAEPELGLPVRKSGRTSGVTAGTVMYVDATVTVDVDEGAQAMWEDQVVTSAISKLGDSGSLVVDNQNCAVGLLFAGSDKTTVCNRITNVLEILGVRFP